MLLSLPVLMLSLELTFQVSEVDPSPAAEDGTEGVVDGAEDVDADAAPIVTCSLVISKAKHPNAMSIDLDASEEGLVITNVAMFERTVALQQGSEGDWARRERYLGPREWSCSAVGAGDEDVDVDAWADGKRVRTR